MEDGEISDHPSPNCNRPARPGDIYDPEYEWPGEPSSVTLDVASSEIHLEEKAPGKKKRKPERPSLRLAVLRTSILPSQHRLAIIDGHSELQLGRDAPLAGVKVPKIRLKEMAVSKLHATVFWDNQQLEWSVVDMGSKHGSFLKHGTSTSDDIGLRLSPSRVASVPKRLRHLDCLTFGNTTFVIHIHDDQLPCEACSPVGGDEIPLFHSLRTAEGTTSKRSRETAGLDLSLQIERNPKKALTTLKHNLLSRHDRSSPSSSDSSVQYIDRSARRRALHPSSHSDSPGVYLTPPLAAPLYTRLPVALEVPIQSPDPAPQPPSPLPTSNVGYRLLMKQGWAPGAALGVPGLGADENRVGLLEPLEVSFTSNRSGLGHAEAKTGSKHVGSFSNWKEEGLCNRWNSVGKASGQ